MARARKTANKLSKLTKKQTVDYKDCFDPNGSYTGSPMDGGKPVQDADDL